MAEFSVPAHHVWLAEPGFEADADARVIR